MNSTVVQTSPTIPPTIAPSSRSEKMGKQKYRRFAISLRDDGAIVGGIVGEVWTSVLFIQFFWIEEQFRG
ncbi:MAG TPA: hypothetical protein VK561_09310, partial [Bradyrhizobium sp.]|nr:hypothetical protein [Bradyrhizobium sp.]